MKKNISSKPQSRNASDRDIYTLTCLVPRPWWRYDHYDLPVDQQLPVQHLNIWHLSNTPTLQHGDTCKLGPVICWNLAAETIHSLEDAAGREAKCQSHWEDFTYTFYMDKTRYKSNVKDFNHWRCCDWKLRIEVRICCAIDPWCWAQLGRHQLLSVESQYKYHKLRTLNCRLEPSWEEYRIHTTDEQTLTFINHEWEHLRLCLIINITTVRTENI